MKTRLKTGLCALSLTVFIITATSIVETALAGPRQWNLSGWTLQSCVNRFGSKFGDACPAGAKGAKRTINAEQADGSVKSTSCPALCSNQKLRDRADDQQKRAAAEFEAMGTNGCRQSDKDVVEFPKEQKKLEAELKAAEAKVALIEKQTKELIARKKKVLEIRASIPSPREIRMNRPVANVGDQLKLWWDNFLQFKKEVDQAHAAGLWRVKIDDEDLAYMQDREPDTSTVDLILERVDNYRDVLADKTTKYIDLRRSISGKLDIMNKKVSDAFAKRDQCNGQFATYHCHKLLRDKYRAALSYRDKQGSALISSVGGQACYNVVILDKAQPGLTVEEGEGTEFAPNNPGSGDAGPGSEPRLPDLEV